MDPSEQIVIRKATTRDDAHVDDFVFYYTYVPIARRTAWRMFLSSDWMKIKLAYGLTCAVLCHFGLFDVKLCIGFTMLLPLAVWLFLRFYLVKQAWRDEIPETPHFADYWNCSGDPTRGLWVATIGGHVVGCIALKEKSPNTNEIQRVVVDPRYRGLGIAKKLMAYVEDKSARDGKRELTLVSSREHREAHRLYRKVGFRCVERVRVYGGIAEIHVFTKHLASSH